MAYQSRISQYEQRGEEAIQDVSDWADEMVQARPLAALCTVFAAGFIVGVGAVAALSSSPPPRKLSSRFGQLEGLSDRIAEAVSRSMPKQLSDLWPRS